MSATDLQLLVQLGTVDDVSCVALTDADHVTGGIPRWAELQLDIEREGKLLNHYLTRHDGEAISLALLRAMHPNAGRGISGLLWEALDQCMVNLLEGGWSGEEKAEEKGLALGLATALALIRSPHSPDVDAIRKEARERYDAME